ncbi:uncharacterized protein LOC115076916 isoform X2 [Rhinatrema bivittatum]|uniref:uncharacterized protein LOC115076916 isoform X2 n=1 Tax=Rhinatrema bivittatum TaxID=194408 RepID=UPI00112ABF9F|nr:uncharacterized protein LOC115076916 isoform X2 [Rhinatrema bivittatum]
MPALLHLCLLLLFSARGSPAPAEGGNVTVYAALGDQAEFILYGALPNYNQTAHTSIEWRMNITINVANFRGSDRTCGDVYKHRCKGYKNGSLHLSNLSRKDSGYYNVDFYNDGKLDAKFWFLLEVQDPVSAPVVTFACHANETAELSCRSENGTRPEYSWTIEGNPLTANFNYSQNGTGILIKPQPVLRTVICTVKNQISERFSHPLNVTCADPVSEPVVNYSCRADGTVELSCSAQNGTRPEYSWTVEGNPLGSGFNYSQNDTRIILIKPQPVLRDVICTVKNQLSERSSHPIKVTCPVPASTSGLTPMLSSTEPHTVNSTVEGKASDITTRPSKNTNTSKTDTCSNHQCFVVSAIWGATVLLVTGLALILGFLCTMPKE